MNIESFDGKYRWLSNFWLCPVARSGYIYPSTENAYQSAKVSKFIGENPFLTCSPAKAKEYGQKMLDRMSWDSVKVDVMRGVLKQKFREGSYLGEKLIDTDNVSIIQGNTWGDKFWGVCDGEGRNMLGFLIMQIRSELQAKA